MSRSKAVPKACTGVKGKCDNFAVEFEKLLLKKRVKGKRLCVKSKTGFVASLNYKNISTNGSHFAVQVGELVFDNLYPDGIPAKEWLDDLGIGEDPNINMKIEDMTGDYNGCIQPK